MNECDVFIIGAGPAGMTAALYAMRYGESVVLADQGAPGGQLLLIDEIENYPGLGKVKGFELAENMEKELGKLDPSKYVVKTIVTTELIRAIAEKFGVKVYNVLTGFKYIAEIVKRNEGKGEFICGGEESYGFNVGEYVRDKDAVIACSMVAECACWAAEQGLTLYQLMQKIYKEFGYYRESLTSLVRKGKAGVEEIAAIMTDMRNNPPAELAGSPVVKVVDYNKPEETGLPKSNVLQFFSEEGDVVSVRPSGTEPKIKFYFGAKGPDADAKIERLRAQFIK